MSVSCLFSFTAPAGRRRGRRGGGRRGRGGREEREGGGGAREEGEGGGGGVKIQTASESDKVKSKLNVNTDEQ